MGSFNVVNCNLTELTTRSICIPLRVLGIAMHLCQCIRQGSALHCVLLCSFVHQRIQRSCVFHIHVDRSCLLQFRYAFKNSFWVVPVVLLYQCHRCPSSLLHGGSWLGYQGLPDMRAVSSRSWLPIVEALGCLRH